MISNIRIALFLILGAIVILLASRRRFPVKNEVVAIVHDATLPD